MIVEIGHFALILAACVALVQGVLPLAGTVNDNQRWQALAKPAAILQFLLIAFAFAVLAHGALTDDFSIKYIAGHSNSLLPTPYKFASVWGGHEGSLLLWMLMLSGWTVAVAIFSRTLPLAMVARVIGILGLVSTGFLMFILITSSPFERLLPAAARPPSSLPAAPAAQSRHLRALPPLPQHASPWPRSERAQRHHVSRQLQRPRPAARAPALPLPQSQPAYLAPLNCQRLPRGS
jgi:hypothetical protein